MSDWRLGDWSASTQSLFVTLYGWKSHSRAHLCYKGWGKLLGYSGSQIRHLNKETFRNRSSISVPNPSVWPPLELSLTSGHTLNVLLNFKVWPLLKNRLEGTVQTNVHAKVWFKNKGLREYTAHLDPWVFFLSNTKQIDLDLDLKFYFSTKLTTL